MINDEYDIDDKLITNFLTGELSRSEMALFLEKMEKDREFRRSFNQTNRIWDASLFTSANLCDTKDSSKKLNEFLNSTVEPVNDRTSKIRQWANWTIGLAASFLFSLLVYNNYFTIRKTEVSSFNEKMLGCILPDSSVVDINKNSKLTYQSKFSGSRREVFLSGEAFFSVKRDVNKPFIIHVNDAEIRVVGTSFNVKAGIHQVVVSVKTGKVMVYFANHPENYSMLLPNEKGIIDMLRMSITKEQHSGNCSVWKNGEFTFNKSSLAEVLQQLGDYYEVKIICDDQALREGSITATFSNQTLDQILDVLSYSDALRFTKKGATIIVEKDLDMD